MHIWILDICFWIIFEYFLESFQTGFSRYETAVRLHFNPRIKSYIWNWSKMLMNTIQSKTYLNHAENEIIKGNNRINVIIHASLLAFNM